MILPDKHLAEDRSLLGVGADVLKALDHPCTVSEAWERFGELRKASPVSGNISFDWFAKALTFLFAINAIRLRDGLLEAESHL
jgi:hypothetical protein